MLNLIKNYFSADGSALHTMKMYAKMSEWLNPTEAFDHAISAATLTWRGQVENDNTLVDKGTSQYVKAIKGLQLALTDPALTQQDHTLAVCVLLSAYEVSLLSSL
jgi:hypothetical protein